MYTHADGLVYLLILAPGGPLSERGDVPERQAPREVDDGQQGAVGTQAHAEDAVLGDERRGEGLFMINNMRRGGGRRGRWWEDKSLLIPFHLAGRRI